MDEVLGLVLIHTKGVVQSYNKQSHMDCRLVVDNMLTHAYYSAPSLLLKFTKW